MQGAKGRTASVGAQGARREAGSAERGAESEGGGGGSGELGGKLKVES